jgi:outer membrane protein
LRARLLVLLLLGSLVGTGSGPAQGQKLPATVAAVVDFQRILSDSKAARSINDQIDARRKSYLDELSREEQRLYDLDKQLVRQRAVLSPEAFSQRRREFEEDVQEIQRLSQERRRQLEGARTAALSEVRSVVVALMDELARDRGFNLVLPSSGVIVFSPTIDLTDTVMAYLDQRLPNVKVPEQQGN